MFAGASECLPSADKWLLHIYCNCILFANTSLERYAFRKQQFSTDIVLKNSKFGLKVLYTLIMNIILVAFAFRPVTIVLYTLSCINNIER